jgi:NAD(P)-dependent dehydrogenase (short-subunit alcohol dehydrogenase family)
MDSEKPDHDKPDPTRRTVVGGLATGLFASAMGPAMAQDGGSKGAQAARHMMPPNYPKPPFPKQQQPWPGLVSKMNPVPDHGEKSYVGSGRLTGRKALITGGDSGMGRAAAIAFAREGADVAINYLPDEEPDAKDVIALIRAEGRKAVAIPGDLKNESFCKRLVADAANALGGLDILVNNAARQIARESILEIRSEEFDETFKTNIYATFWLSKAAVPLMKPGSAIINTTSVTAYEPPEVMIDYAATKAAIMNFTKGLAKQLATKGIRVNGVAPGPIWTALQVTGGQLPDKLPQFGADSPMGRPGQPAELAALYVLLATNEASYSTGQIFGAVGGRGGP